jgi:carboxypeptidase family protein
MFKKMGTTKAAHLLVLSLLLLLCPVVVSAQATSSTSGVTGVVTDTTGAVVAGATVTLVDTKTSQERATTTDEQGKYMFSQVQPGRGYKLTFSSPGFQNFELNLALGVGVIETQNVELTAGQVTETVTVTDQGGATLNTTDASIGNVIDERRLKELPIQLRASPAALIGLQPGVVGNDVGSGVGASGANRAGSVTGSRADQGNITVDGIDANDQATGQFAATTGNAPIDAIQEFRTVSTNPGASEGRSSGGQIELITKSGTNQFHGSLREFNRTALTAANSFFNNRNGVKRPQLTRNQFGGSIGGPIYFPRFGEGGDSLYSGKGKLFFFYDYEARRDAQGITLTRIVPLQHVREGGLGFLNNTAGCALTARLNTTPQCISILTPAQVAALDPQGIGVNQALLQFINQRYPLPNDLSGGNGINTGAFRFNAPIRRNDKNHTGRIDWNITDRQRMFGRISKVANVQTDFFNTGATPAQFPGDPETSQVVLGDWAFVVGHNWVLTSNIVNQATVGISKSAASFPNNFHPTSPNFYSSFGGLITAPYTSYSAQFREVPVPQFRDDLTWTKGTHTMSFGGSFKPISQRGNLLRDFNYITVGLGGNFSTSLGTSINANRPANIRPNSATAANNYDATLAFLLGVIPSITTVINLDAAGNPLPLGTGSNRDWRYNELELYAQDTWRARSDLTITAGVRWHLYPAPYEAQGRQSQVSNVDFETLFNQRITNGLAGIAGPTSEPFLTYVLGGKANNAPPLYKTDYNNFGPRLSFAWNPSFKSGILGGIMGDRKTVIRGGGSVTYDRPSGGITFQQDQHSYFFDSTVVNNLTAANGRAALLNFPRVTGIGTVPFQNTAPHPTVPFTPFIENGVGVGLRDAQNNTTTDPNFKIPYSIQYSFGFQRELPGNFILEASYVGRQGRQLFVSADSSQIVDFRDNASGQFMIAAMNNLQSQLEANPGIIAGTAHPTPVPWFENQINAALAPFGITCVSATGASCTEFVTSNFGFLVEIGDTADTVQGLYAAGLLRPNVGLSSQFGGNAWATNKGSSSYDGLLISLRKRFSQGLQFDVNYTLSHSIDNQSTVVNVVPTGQTNTTGGLICDATNLRVCRGNSDFDIRHLFNVNGIWELPIGRGHMLGGNAPGWLNQIIGGWQVSGIFSARSGLPFSLATSSWPRSFFYDANFGVPAVITGDPSVFRPSIHNGPGGTIQFFADPEAARAATAYPRHGQPGNRNTLRSTPFYNLDTLVTKNFKLPWSETQRLQIRWEAYNALNHHTYSIPSSIDIGSTTFGQVTGSASAARVMQFGIRWDF